MTSLCRSFPRKRESRVTRTGFWVPAFAGTSGWHILAAVVITSALLDWIISAIAAEIPLSERKSGYDMMGRESRAMHALGARW